MAKEAKSELRKLGSAIRAHRAELGLSQEDFAERCELHRTYVGQLERGEKNISFSNVLKLAKAFGLPASALLASAGL